MKAACALAHAAFVGHDTFNRRSGALRLRAPALARGVLHVASEGSAMLQGLTNISVERLGAAGIVTMRRAEKRNALSLEMMRELEAALRMLGADSGVRAIVIAAEGPAFSSGHDLRELHGRDEAAYTEIFDACVRLMAAIGEVPQPVIAEVQALATAAGCQLVAACDLAVAAEPAQFATPGVRIGLFCSTPMVALSRAIGRKRAMHMLLTGEPVDARTALDWGLVNTVVSERDLRPRTLELVASIARASRRVVGIGKQAFYRQIDLPLEEAYAYAKGVMVDNAGLPDAQEGIGAFLGKRPPNWPA